jgi:hypothetical protein
VRRDDEALAAFGSPQIIQSEAAMRLSRARNEREVLNVESCADGAEL